MCKIYGYHRTSTKDQHLDRGLTAINTFSMENDLTLDTMFTDQQTGKNFDRPDYQLLKRIAKSGDTLIISEIDRLGRNKADVLKELRHFKDNNIRVKVLELPTTLIDYSAMSDEMAQMMMDTINNMLIEMYASLAHAEMMKRSKRQMEGIEEMKRRGEFDKYGRPCIEIDDTFMSAYKQWKNGEITAVKAMNQCGMTKSTFYRKVKEYEAK